MAAGVPTEGAPTLSAEHIRGLETVLYAYARRAVGDPDARDVVQETLLAACAADVPSEARARLRAWAIGVLTHKIMDLFRARARAPLVGDDDSRTDDLAEPSSRRSPERLVARRETVAILEGAIRSLPELERLAVLLVDVEGFEHEEARVELAVNATHLRVLLHRGRHRLRRALARAGVSNAT
jgi:RNA polymerase sigma-70 factor (ECF subfamily)